MEREEEMIPDSYLAGQLGLLITLVSTNANTNMD
jgi:hypothetical protein